MDYVKQQSSHALKVSNVKEMGMPLLKWKCSWSIKILISNIIFSSVVVHSRGTKFCRFHYTARVVNMQLVYGSPKTLRMLQQTFLSLSAVVTYMEVKEQSKDVITFLQCLIAPLWKSSQLSILTVELCLLEVFLHYLLQEKSHTHKIYWKPSHKRNSMRAQRKI